MILEDIRKHLGLKSEKVKVEEQHVCEICGKGFKNKGALGSHKRACMMGLGSV